MSSLWFGVDQAGAAMTALQFEHLSLQHLGLSQRTLNALLRYNIAMTVADIIRAEEDFATIRGLGSAGLKELEAKLAQVVAGETGTVRQDRTAMQPLGLNGSQASVPASGSSPKTLPQSTYALPVSYLHLDAKTYEELIQAGITTIGQLYTTDHISAEWVKRLPSSSLRTVNDQLVTMRTMLKDGNEVDWLRYWEVQGIHVLPSGAVNPSPEDLFTQFPTIIKEILLQECDERAWIIIQRRFGLGNVEKLTLEDIGDAYGLSRERIRQVEEKTLRILELVLKSQLYTGKPYRIHPHVYQLIHTILRLVESEPGKLILETKLLTRVHQTFGVDEKHIRISLRFLLSVLGMECIEVNYPQALPIWGYSDAVKRRLLEHGLKRLDDLLTRETSLPLLEFDILAQMNKGVKKADKVTLADLPLLINVCSTVERREDGSVWGKFEYLKSRGNQVERLLAEAGTPLSAADLAREINHRLVPLGQRPIADFYLVNQLIGDARFASIGRSGLWTLTSWEHVDTSSILTLMEQYFITQNKPVTADELYFYVSERRPVSKKSITTYLGMEKERFVKVGPMAWGLAVWADSHSADAWNTAKIADFIATLFRTEKAKELDYKVVKKALMDATGISAQRAQGLLNSNPALKTRKGKTSDERIAIFQPQYKEILAQSQTSRSRGSLRSQVEERARHILAAVPNQQMPMVELVRALQTQFECAETTLYAYVSQMKSIERVEIADSGRKMCRLKDLQEASPYRTLQERVEKSVRAILESQPGQQIALSDLLRYLRKEYQCPKATLYQYIARLDYIERVMIPHSTAKICRIKATHAARLAQRTQEIGNVTLRENVQSAIADLTEERVDIGLFRLGREFETTLKRYLVAALAKGKLPKGTPSNKHPNQLRLADMIICLKNNGIVTDDAVLNYLRQERNDRAHSATPSLDERRKLMNNVEYLAGLYVDYIALLDTRLQQL